MKTNLTPFSHTFSTNTSCWRHKFKKLVNGSSVEGCIVTHVKTTSERNSLTALKVLYGLYAGVDLHLQLPKMQSVEQEDLSLLSLLIISTYTAYFH